MLLEHAQQLHLQRQRQLADLVEEERAAVGRLEETRLVADGAGEGALHVAEELGLEQVLRDRRAVDRDEGARSARSLSAWIARATSSLPVPLSPAISTLVLRRGDRGPIIS